MTLHVGRVTSLRSWKGSKKLNIHLSEFDRGIISSTAAGLTSSLTPTTSKHQNTDSHSNNLENGSNRNALLPKQCSYLFS